jgi:hypothetical protein
MEGGILTNFLIEIIIIKHSFKELFIKYDLVIGLAKKQGHGSPAPLAKKRLSKEFL